MGPPSHDLYIPLFQSWPSQDAIMTGQLKNHDRPMFAIIAGSTYNIAIPCYQSLPGQLITWPSHVYNRSRSRCHPMLCYNHGQVKIQPDSAMISILTPQGFQSWPAMISILTWSGFQSCLRKDFNPDPAMISILTAQGFQSWLRKDFQSWPRKDFNPDSFKRRQDYFSQDFWRPRLPDN